MELLETLQMEKRAPEPVRAVMARLDDAGYEAYLVGGCVRDLLLGKAPHDWDVCTDALPDQTRRVFCAFRTVDTGARHGTLTVLAEGLPVEVTTYRVDGTYSDHRRPDGVTFTRCLREDLARRDFTINAMAYRPAEGLVDWYGGRDDLRAGRIRCVGDARARFAEDALRMLRALRFASRFGFSIEERTAQALLDAREGLRYIARERVLAELCGTDFARVDARFLPVLQVVLPALERLDVPAGLPPDSAMQLGALLRGLDARGILAAMHASRALAEEAGLLAQALDEPPARDAAAVRRALRRMGPDTARKLFVLQSNAEGMAVLEAVLARGDCYTLAGLAVGGEEMRALGLAGPQIGRALAALLDRVIDGELPNEREALLAACRRGMGESPRP